MNAQYAQDIDTFLLTHDVAKWFIASDYSMGRSEFSHDAMTFVLIPYIAEMFPPTEVEINLPVDFKDCGKSINPSYISYLRSAPVFSFVFLLDRSQKVFAHASLAAQAVERGIQMMKAWPNANEPQNADIEQ